MFEKWEYVADWALLVFAPTDEVNNAIQVRIVGNDTSREVESLVMSVRKGASAYGNVSIMNHGSLDVALSPSGIPNWLKLKQSASGIQKLHAGETLNLNFEVLTDELSAGTTTSSTLLFHIQDDSYPDCFYVQEKALRITVSVSLGYSFYLMLALFIIAGFAAVHTYVERRRKEADSMWEVKASELVYDDPPEILGRGTFGLVVCAEYRGTMVAVKRVIPPQDRTASVESNATAIFDFNDDFDEEEVKSQPGYGSGKFSRRGSLQTKTVGFTNHGHVGGEGVPLNSTNDNVNGSVSWVGSSSGYGSRSQRSISFLKEDFVQEMRVLSTLRHPCITTFMGAVTARGEEPLLVMECMDRGSLYDILQNPSMVFEGGTVLSILRDISKGMRFLHSSSPQIIHGDLKAANVLVDANFCAKVTDFGFSIKKKVGASGTPFWMAPELLSGASNSTSSDSYSFGILLYEVFSRQDPYSGLDFDAIVRDICDPCIKKRPPVPKSMPSEVSSLLYLSCIDADPAARPTFTELDTFLTRFQVKNVDPGEQKVLHRQTSESDRLLDEIFPPPVALALREGRKVEPEHFDSATIFFSDIVGFTPLSSTMSPWKVSDMVDRLYGEMDSLSHKFGVYKLETIGDAWVGVTNLYNACPEDHAKRIALFALEGKKQCGM
ncbi:hypothetical protein ACHAXR_002817 [Thalassiosira sp. AJA248-18]